MKTLTRVLLLAGLAAVAASPAPAQSDSPALDPARLEQELTRARDEKWPMVAVQLTSGRYVAFDPTRVKAVAGNHVTVGGRSGWAEATSPTTDDERIYFALKYALTFEESCPMASYTVTKAVEIDVSRLLAQPPLLDAGAGANRKEWVGSMLNRFSGMGGVVVQILALSKKDAPKIKFDSLLLQLVNPGSTGLTPEMEAAFMDTLVSSRPNASWKVLKTPPESQTEGTVLEVRVHLQQMDPRFLAVAYTRVDRATGDVRTRAFGRGVIGGKVEKDIRTLADTCW